MNCFKEPLKCKCSHVRVCVVVRKYTPSSRALACFQLLMKYFQKVAQVLVFPCACTCCRQETKAIIEREKPRLWRCLEELRDRARDVEDKVASLEKRALDEMEQVSWWRWF